MAALAAHAKLAAAGPGAASRLSLLAGADLAEALAAGKLTAEVLERYLRLSEGMLGPLMKLGCAARGTRASSRAAALGLLAAQRPERALTAGLRAPQGLPRAPAGRPLLLCQSGHRGAAPSRRGRCRRPPGVQRGRLAARARAPPLRCPAARRAPTRADRRRTPQVGIGIFTKSSAEYTKRGKNFSKELDFVAANIIMALVADFMLVWLPAPTLSFACAPPAARRAPCACVPARADAHVRGAAGRALPQSAAAWPPSWRPARRTRSRRRAPSGRGRAVGAVRSWVACMAPCSAGPRRAAAPRAQVPKGYAPFSAAQRFGAVLRNGVKLAGVGFGSSLIGVTVTNVIVTARQMLDPNFAPPNAPQARARPRAARSRPQPRSRAALRRAVRAGRAEHERRVRRIHGRQQQPALPGALYPTIHPIDPTLYPRPPSPPLAGPVSALL